jgi:hypothetical protein
MSAPVSLSAQRQRTPCRLGAGAAFARHRSRTVTRHALPTDGPAPLRCPRCDNFQA